LIFKNLSYRRIPIVFNLETRTSGVHDTLEEITHKQGWRRLALYQSLSCSPCPVEWLLLRR